MFSKGKPSYFELRTASILKVIEQTCESEAPQHGKDKLRNTPNAPHFVQTKQGKNWTIPTHKKARPIRGWTLGFLNYSRLPF